MRKSITILFFFQFYLSIYFFKARPIISVVAFQKLNYRPNFKLKTLSINRDSISNPIQQ